MGEFRDSNLQVCFRWAFAFGEYSKAINQFNKYIEVSNLPEPLHTCDGLWHHTGIVTKSDPERPPRIVYSDRTNRYILWFRNKKWAISPKDDVLNLALCTRDIQTIVAVYNMKLETSWEDEKGEMYSNIKFATFIEGR